MEFKNISPLGDLDIPGVGVVPAGERFEVTGEQAASFELQTDNFLRTDKPVRKRAASKAAAKTATPTPPAGDGSDSTEETS